MKETGTSDVISHFIKNWFEIEIYTKKKYAFLAKHTENAQAKAVFNQLSLAGERHAKNLQRIKELLIESGEINKEVTLPVSVRIPEESKPQRWKTSVEATYHAMKSHLKIEAGLEEAYEEISKKITNQEAKKRFHTMAMDEKKHHELLRGMIRLFEQIFKDTLKQ